MFTGIVEDVGTIVSLSGDASGRGVTIRSDLVSGDLPVGASVAVAGVCLTATAVAGDTFSVDVVAETLEKTNLGRLRIGDGVNLERAMPAEGRFDGHIVQGHVDGLGRVLASEPEGIGRRLTIEVPRSMLRWIVAKGSLTVDGVSLTVADLGEVTVEIALIPHTLDATTLGRLRQGDEVNLEGDILGKYVARIMETES
ncbi:MAG TPA: riboflavin synthase [Acidimicrobiia bacterium]